MNEMIIPGTDKILLDGTILVLSGFDGVKYIMHNGFYNYAGEMFEGWYGVSIPDQNIIPMAQQMLLGCEIFYYPNSNCSCRFPNGNIPYTTDDKFQLQRAFITVDTMNDRDGLSPRLSITDLPNGKIVRVNKPNNIDFEPKYYIYRYNANLTGAYWEEYQIYVKPLDGIPKSDLSGDVQESLNKADTALQELPIATTETLGGIVVGENLNIDEDGVLSAQAAIETYTLRWSDNIGDFRESNFSEISRFRNLDIGAYSVFLQFNSGSSLDKIEAYEIKSGITLWFRGSWDGESETIYKISCGLTLETYTQTKYDIPSSDFDPTSLAAPSMYGTAEYIDTRIGTTGNLDPDSYALASDVNAIEDLIPAQASDQNQLADKNFVNSTVATNTAYFVGTFDSIQTLTLYDGTVTNNDYAFVVIYNSADPTQVDAYDRFKYNDQEYGYIALDTLTAPTWVADTYYDYNRNTNEYVLTESEPEDWSTNWNDYFVEKSTPGCWKFEYELNNSSFTSEQWAAINSGMTSSLVTRMNNHMADTTIHVTTQEKTTWNAKYDKPATGIPSTDLSSGVQASLGKADSALQSIPTASDQVLGGVKVGDNLSINDGVLSLDAGVGVSDNENTLIISTEAPSGFVAGNGINITNEIVSIDNTVQTKPNEVDSGTVIELADNTEYRLTDITDLTLTYPQGNFECWMRLTFASSGTITVTLPTSSYIGSAPNFANGEIWELSIKDGVVVAGKVNA